MIIHCSKNLITQFNIAVSDPIKENHALFTHLCAHNFYIGKVSFIIFFDATTLFSVFYIKEPEHTLEIDKLYAYSIAITLECYGYGKNEISNYLQHLVNITYMPLKSRTMLAALKMKIKQFKEIFVSEINTNGTANIEEIADLINSEPCKISDEFHSPKSIFLKQIPHVYHIKRTLQ